MSFTIEIIAHLIQGRIVGDPNTIITAPCKIEEGFEGGISFLSNTKYESHIYTTKASALIVPNDIVLTADVKATLIYVDNVYVALGTLLNAIDQKEKMSGIATSALIKDTAQVAASSYIGDFTIISEGASIGENTTIYDQVFIGKNVRIGANTTIYQGVKIYKDCVIGDNCIIHSNTVIGSDGFGFVPQADGTYSKLPQIGNVVIENDVEIGANTVVDRATMGSTTIKSGAKLDNLIQIAHNVVVGSNTVIAAQAGIAGSAQIGENCMIGGQVGMAGHIKVANKTMIQAKSGISSNITEEGRKLYGYPALEYQNYLKSYAHFKNLDKLVDKLRKLEKEIDQLKQN